MKIALYDENHGYYTKNIRTVGRSGDFSTLATINDTLARSICSWIKNRWKQSKIIKGNIGDAILYPGGITHPHSGIKIKSGVRYLLLFSLIDENI